MKHTILLVEDDPLMSDLYATILRTDGFEVEQVMRGEEAFPRAAAVKPVLIVLDLMMPHVSGMDVLISLKATGATSHVPVIMVTNYPDRAIGEQALERGASRYILKSEYLPRAFVELVKEVLKESGPKRQATKS